MQLTRHVIVSQLYFVHFHYYVDLLIASIIDQDHHSSS